MMMSPCHHEYHQLTRDRYAKTAMTMTMLTDDDDSHYEDW